MILIKAKLRGPRDFLAATTTQLVKNEQTYNRSWKLRLAGVNLLFALLAAVLPIW